MDTLDTARLVLVVLHLIGLAAIIGPFLLQLRATEAPVLRTMLAGAVVQLVTGAALVAVRSAGGLDVDPAQIVTKLGAAVLVLVAVVGATVLARRSPAAARTLVATAGILAITDTAIAVLWR